MRDSSSSALPVSDSNSYQCTSKQDEMILGAHSGYLERVEYCLDDEKVNVNEKGNKSRTALEFACAEGHVEIVKLLLDREARLEYHCLLAACMKGHHLVVDHLLKIQKGLYVASLHQFQTIPLHATCMIGQDGIAKKPLGRGANIHAAVKGNTPLHYCCLTLVRSRIFDGLLRRNLLSCIDLLVRHGGDMNKKNEQGETPRYLIKHWRLLENHEKKMKVLEERASSTRTNQETGQMIGAEDDNLEEANSIFDYLSCTESYKEDGSLNFNSATKVGVKTVDSENDSTFTQKQPQHNHYVSQHAESIEGSEEQCILEALSL